MDERPAILFFVDEQLPVRLIDAILVGRGHQVTPVQIGFKDPAILVTADEVGAVIITADRWFLRELFRLPIGHKQQRYIRAGVVQVAGEWDQAEPRLREYLPLIETAFTIRQKQPDMRFGINMADRMIHIEEARPSMRTRPPSSRQGRGKWGVGR